VHYFALKKVDVDLNRLYELVRLRFSRADTLTIYTVYAWSIFSLFRDLYVSRKM